VSTYNGQNYQFGQKLQASISQWFILFKSISMIKHELKGLVYHENKLVSHDTFKYKSSG
jgi:hypothetical protein